MRPIRSEVDLQDAYAALRRAERMGHQPEADNIDRAIEEYVDSLYTGGDK